MEIQRREPYPKWVQDIAEEEWVLQGIINNNIYNKLNVNIHVHRSFIWIDSRQGINAWHRIYYQEDYTLLKKRAEKNGYKTSDSLFNKDGKLDYVKLPS